VSVPGTSVRIRAGRRRGPLVALATLVVLVLLQVSWSASGLRRSGDVPGLRSIPWALLWLVALWGVGPYLRGWRHWD
jgi:hypothetical protein